MTDNIWMGVGFFAQALFSARFFVQWLASEKAGKSVMPILFWYFSIGGSSILLAYAVHRMDPVFILGQSFGLVIYLRNLYLIRREKKTLA
ncbi:MAG: lipid A biosynthesis protein [Deltaproteobacteria bacterium]|nr:lipid A biosynthesis protein [Deltaproteobacteria bacterium]